MNFKNTDEAIIDEETWELAHRLRKTIRKPSYPDRPANPLTGLVYCADCGHKLTHRQPSPDKEKIFDADNAYVCGNYRQLTRDCTIHFIKTSALQDLILSAIREVSTFVPPKQEVEAPTLTAEQQEVERKKEIRRDREREQNRLRMQRVRAAQKAALRAEDMAKGVHIPVSGLPIREPQIAANSTRTATL